MATTTIAVSYETKEILRRLCEKNESYENIIQKLIREAGLKKLDRQWNKILKEDKFILLDEL